MFVAGSKVTMIFIQYRGVGNKLHCTSTSTIWVFLRGRVLALALVLNKCSGRESHDLEAPYQMSLSCSLNFIAHSLKSYTLQQVYDDITNHQMAMGATPTLA